MARIKLGMRARDVVTRMEGIVMARIIHLTGCDRYHIQPPGMDDKGQQKEGAYFDESRIEILDATPIQLVGELPAGPTPG